MTIKPGKYTARVVDYAFRTTKSGDPEPQVRFRWIDEENNVCEWNWRGSLKEGKAREITLKALGVCGFTGDDLSVIADGVSSAALDTSKDVSISVILEKGTDGKDYPKINWVNEVGGATFQETIDRGQAKLLLQGMNIKADLAAMKSTKKVQPTTQTTEIPF